MPEDITWREFELLVARIEKQLSPLGAIVKSPDIIVDKVSGSPREVDASIRYVVGSTPILITIECRNREKVQDDIWIEQLAKKKEKIGASATIAVSKNGFSQPSKKTAEHYNIELRTLQEIADSQNLEWLGNVQLKVELLFWRYVSIEVGFDAPNTQITIDSSVDKRIKELGYEAHIGEYEDGKSWMTLEQIGSGFVENGEFPRAPGIKPFGRVTPENGPIYIATNEGKTRIRYIDIMLEIVGIEQPIPAVKAFDYSSNLGTVVQVAEFEFQFKGGSFKVGVVHQPK